MLTMSKHVIMVVTALFTYPWYLITNYVTVIGEIPSKDKNWTTAHVKGIIRPETF